MAVSFRILPRHNVVLVTFAGLAGHDETIACMAEYTAHPDFRPWQRHVVDVSRIRDYERNVPGFLQMQARGMDVLPMLQDLQIVFYAPTRIGQEMAGLIRKSWEGLDKVILSVLEDETQVLALLGVPGDRLADLLPDAAPQASDAVAPGIPGADIGSG